MTTKKKKQKKDSETKPSLTAKEKIAA